MEYNISFFYDKFKIKKNIKEEIKEKKDIFYSQLDNEITNNDTLNLTKITQQQLKSYGYCILSIRYTKSHNKSTYKIKNLDFKIIDETHFQILENIPNGHAVYIKRLQENKHICYLIEQGNNGIKNIIDKKIIFI